MFYMMGYRSSGQDSLVLEGQVDQDKVTTVARDCILAYVECQVSLYVYKKNVKKIELTFWKFSTIIFAKNMNLSA